MEIAIRMGVVLYLGVMMVVGCDGKPPEPTMTTTQLVEKIGNGEKEAVRQTLGEPQAIETAGDMEWWYYDLAIKSGTGETKKPRVGYEKGKYWGVEYLKLDKYEEKVKGLKPAK